MKINDFILQKKEERRKAIIKNGWNTSNPDTNCRAYEEGYIKALEDIQKIASHTNFLRKEC